MSCLNGRKKRPGVRLKRPVGQRLATSAMVMVYGGTHAFTGPTIAGCAVTCANATTKFSVSFDKTLLRGSKLVVRPYDTAFPNRSAFLVFANLSAAEQAWIPVNVAASTTDPTAIEVDLAPLKGAPPLAVRYAWSGLAAANGDDVRCCMKDVLDGAAASPFSSFWNISHGVPSSMPRAVWCCLRTARAY